MLSGHFYHATIRKIVAAFGTVFNNISVVRKDQTGKVINIQRVPLAYGPKQKFLTRIDEQKNLQGNKIAIKLPRMSFEIVTMVYDATTKINRNNTISVTNPDDPLSRTVVRQFAPYRMGIQLSIMAKNQDDALQVIEQILPYFQPEYTITVKDVEGMDIPNDVPIVLTSIQMNEEYEGDFMTRRAIIYTLDFELRVRFYGPVSQRGITKTVVTNFIDSATGFPQIKMDVAVDPKTALPTDPYNIVVNIAEFTLDTSTYYINVEDATGFLVGEILANSDSASTAVIHNITGNTLHVIDADGVFFIGHHVTGDQSGITSTITSVTGIYS